MVVILGRLVIGAASRAAFEAAASDAIAATRCSAGCLHYEFARDLADPGVFHISEVWATEGDLDAHVASGHHARFRAALATCEVAERRVERFDNAERTRLPGPVIATSARRT